MTIAIFLIVIGVIQSAWMIWAIRTDAAATHLSVIETAILKIGKADALSKSKSGLAYDRLMLWFGLVLGIAFLGSGLTLTFVE